MTFEISKFLLLVTAKALVFLGWLLCIDVANSVYWRVWHFSSLEISTIWIGLWKVCYLRQNAVITHPTVVCIQLNSSWNYPIEFRYCQDLIILPIFLQMTGLIFSLGAFLILFKDESYPRFIDTCHLIAGCCYTLSSICVGVSVTWNSYMDLTGLSTLETPKEFPAKMSKLTRRDIGLVLPLGITSATCSFISGICLFCQTCCSKLSRVHPQGKNQNQQNKTPNRVTET